MAGYTKLFSSIIASTIWREDDKTRIVWITMLAMSDQRGVVEASLPGLADMARVSIAEAQAAIAALSAPDPYSRTKTNDGRRIEETEGGWRLLNHGKYREKMNSDDRREYLRKKQQEHREKRQHGVNKRQQMSTRSTHAEAEADNTRPAGRGAFPALAEVITYGETVLASRECSEAFWNAKEADGWTTKNGHTVADWRAMFRNWSTSWKANEAKGKQRGGKPQNVETIGGRQFVNGRDAKGQRPGEIETDVSLAKVKML